MRDALDGLQFVLREPAIRATTVLSVLGFGLAYSVVAVVLPVVYERLDQPERLGVLFMAFSAGGVAGALVYAAVAEKAPRRAAFVIGLVAASAVALVYVIAPPYWLQVVVMAVAGFLTGAVNPVANVVLQERTSEEMRGRALSMAFALSYAIFSRSATCRRAS